MYFKRIEMHGFKSFAEPVVIELHEGVTCIVGPNGSGKSNISDAIRWVLGEQSPKMLRGGKMEEVIFAGTANRKSRGMAEVTLVIDNSMGILPIDYNEVAITRRMYRSGESEYLINNNQCRLRDIRELIMDTGIGVDGYSIIGQGKIADIVSNKPESRREIFEEAAGIVMYKSKKAESERKLSSTNANLERVNDIIGEIEGRIDILKDDSVKAKEYLELKDKYKDLEINIVLKSVEKLELANEMIKDDISELSVSIEEAGEEKKALEDKLAADRQKNQNLELLSNDARDKLLAKVEEINRLTNKSQLDTERLSTIDRDTERINSEIEVIKEKLSGELESMEKLNADRLEIVSNLKAADEELSSKVNDYNKVTVSLTQLGEQIDEKKNSIFELTSEASSKRSEAKSIDSYKDSLNRRKEQLSEEEQLIKSSVRETAEALTNARSDRDSLQEQIKKTEDALSCSKNEKKSCESEINQLSIKSEDLRIRAGQLTGRKKTIEEMESNYEGYNGAVRAIMKAGLKGLEGVVAELMTVPAGYEIAVETALGGAMQNIVCGNDSSAKAAVNYLKSNKSGRLTFLPVESVKGQALKPDGRLESSPGFMGCAVDIIDFDSRYKGIFSYLLGRVVIVDNMDNAVKLSKQISGGIRLVTMDGEVINASGAITGGKYKNATANLLERKAEIVKLDKEIAGLKENSRAIQNQSEKLKNDLLALNEAISEKEGELRNQELKLINLESTIRILRENDQKISENTEKNTKEFLSIKNDLENAESMTLKLLADAEAKEKEVETLKENISTDMSNYEAVKEQVDKAAETITQTRITKTQWDNKKDAIDDILSRIKLAVTDYENQVAERLENLTNLEEEKNKIVFGSEDVETNVQTLAEEKSRLEEYISEITEEKTQLSSSINSMTAEQLAIGEKLNANQDQKYQQEIKLAKNETQLDTFKEKLWDEFEVSYAQAVGLKQKGFVMSTAVKESRDIKNRIRELGDVNVGAIKEYEQVSERYRFLTEQRADILDAMNELKSIIDDMDKTIKRKFKENFDQVVVNFEKIFEELFEGGHAELRLDDEDNPLEAGIEIIAQPPGKKLQNINLMSGGEKTMTAIALMFAVLKTKPTPFCILDEVEAALDDANIDRFATYLRNFNDIQFAIVTHQKATMEHADVLYGVTMPEQGISKVLSLRLGDDFEL